MLLRPPCSTRTHTLLPYTSLFRSVRPRPPSHLGARRAHPHGRVVPACPRAGGTPHRSQHPAPGPAADGSAPAAHDRHPRRPPPRTARRRRPGPLLRGLARVCHRRSPHREPFVRRRPRQIGRAHVRTPVTNAHLVCRLLLEKNTHTTKPY